MGQNDALLVHGNIRIKRTRYGLMAYNINDFYIGRSIDSYGEYCPGEPQLFAQLITPGSLVVDVGANIGAHTLMLGQAVGAGGTVIAMEPERVNHLLLCTNLALNEVNNVRVLNVAVGQAPGQIFVPRLDHSKPGNFGGVELSSERGDPIEMINIDGLRLPDCRFIKIDVEGGERSVIAGAAQTINRFRPVLYVENDRRQYSAELINQLRALGYTLYWHLPALYSPENLYGNPTNLFPGIVSLCMLCLHSSDGRRVTGFRPVTGPDDWPT